MCAFTPDTPPPPLKLPCEPPADECVGVDDDNISVSTDASCITDHSWETVSDTGSKTAKAGKKKKKKSGAARVPNKERPQRFLGAQGSRTALPGHKSIGAVGGRYLVVHFSAMPPSKRPGIAASLAF